VLGVGWQGSGEPANFTPQLAAARERFPDQPDLAFPAEERRYGVQNAYVQALADLGLVGTGVAVALFAIALAAAVGAARAAPAAARWAGALALGWLVLVLGLWAAQGLVAGVPLGALTWIAVGTAATAATLRRRADA
jgi:O-antigen ligase